MSGALGAIGSIGGTLLGGPVGGMIGGTLGGMLGGGGGMSGGSSGKSTQSSRPVDLTLPWFSQLGQTASGSLGNFIGAGANPDAIYSGDLTGDMRGREWAALNATQGTALNPLRSMVTNAIMSGAMMPGQPLGNQFLNPLIEMAQRPTMEALQHSVGRQIPGFAAAHGHQGGQTIGSGSTAKDLQQIRASEIGARAMGDIATGIGNNAWNTGFQGMLQGVQLQQQDIGAMIANLQAQGLPRTIEDQGIQRAIALGQQAQQNWLQGLQVATAMPLQATGNVSQGTSTQSSSPGLVNTLFGNQGLIPGLNSAMAPTLAQGGRQMANPTIWNSGWNPFSNVFGGGSNTMGWMPTVTMGA